MTERRIRTGVPAESRHGLVSRVRDWWSSRPSGSGPTYGPTDTFAAIGPMVAPAMLGKPSWLPKDPTTFSREGYEKLALIFRCVGMTANAVASAPVRVRDSSRGGEELPTHPMRQLMARPNPSMGEARFMAFVGMVMTVCGFCVVEKERFANTNEVAALWPLRSDWLRPIARVDAAPDWEYRVPGVRRPEILKAEDVLVFPYADRPDGSAYGIGPLESVLRDVGLINKMSDFLKAFFDSGAMPVYGIVPDTQPGQQLTKMDVEALRSNWVRRLGGLTNAVEPAVLSGIKDVKRLSFDFDELALTDIRDLSDLAICQGFGIHPAMVGARIGLEHSDSRANSFEARRGFYEDTISPLWSRIDDILTLGLLSEYEPVGSSLSLEFDTSDVPAFQSDRSERATWLVSAGSAGLITVHTFHRELGLPIPAGDDFYLRGMATVAVPASDPLEAVALSQASAVRVREVLSRDEDGRLLLAAETDPTPEILELMAQTGAPETRARAAVDARRRIARLTATAAPLLERFLAAQGARIASAVLSPVGVAGASDDVWERLRLQDNLESLAVSDVPWTDEELRLGRIMERVNVNSIKNALDFAAAQTNVSITFDLANPQILSVRDRLAQRVVGINATTRGIVSDTVARGLQNGLSTKEIADNIQSSVGSEARAMTIARTESMVGFGYASNAGYRLSRVVDRVQLFDNPRHTSSYNASDGLTCAERNGKIVDLADADGHVDAEHPNGSLCTAPVVRGTDPLPPPEGPPIP